MSFRVFLTGGTGYIGSAVLDALVRGGHQVTAIARDPEKVARARVARRHRAAGRARHRRPATWTCAIERRRRASTRPWTTRRADRSSIVELLDRLLPALSDTGSAKTFVYTSGIWVIGPAPDPVDETAALAPTPLVAWRVPTRAARAGGDDHEPAHRRRSPRRRLRRRRAASSSDLLRDALNGLVRVIGPGTNHWPCVYDRDLADLYARIAQTPEALRRLPRQRRGRRDASTTSSKRSPTTSRSGPTSATCRLAEARAKHRARTPTRWRSTSGCGARGPAHSAGRRP